MFETTFIKNGKGKEIEVFVGRMNKWDYFTKSITKDCVNCDDFIGMVEARPLCEIEKAENRINLDTDLGLCVRGNVRKILVEDEEERHRCPYNYF